MELQLGLVQINVTDIGDAWQFYVGTLGLRGEKRLGPEKPFHLLLPGSPPVLVYSVQRMTNRVYPEDTGVTLVFYTPDIRKTVKTWAERGVSFVPIAWSREASGIAETPFGPFIAFRDPFGNVHELLQPT